MLKRGPKIKQAAISPKRLDDAINLSVQKEYTQIPNEILRNSNISGKAKALLCLLLSNKDGWRSYVGAIKKYMMEKETSIRSSLNELESHGYLMKVKYRDASSKTFQGTFWAYSDTPHAFDTRRQRKTLKSLGFEAIEPEVGNPRMGNPRMGNPPLKRLRVKKTNLMGEANGVILPFDSKLFQKAWESFQTFKSEEFGHTKLGLTHQKGLLTRLKNLSNNDESIAIKIIEQSIQRRWKGFFELEEDKSNEWVKKYPDKKPMPPPEDIIAKRMKELPEGSPNIMTENFNRLLNGQFKNRSNFSNESSLAMRLCDLHEWITQTRPDNIYEIHKDSRKVIGSAPTLISRYIDWLEEEKWIDNIDLRLFTPNYSLMKRFFNQRSKAIGLNVLTGLPHG
jgi:hypothetical protein